MSKFSNLIGYRRKPTKQEMTRRRMHRLVNAYPDLFPLAVRDGTMDVMDMPADSIDWAIKEIERRQR